MRKASPVLLEPMMAFEVETPEDYAGTVMGDLSSRRGMVQGMDDMVGGGKVIKAEVPLAVMFGYANNLRSEEHTSELQSLMRISSAVFCLKKQTHNYITNS